MRPALFLTALTVALAGCPREGGQPDAALSLPPALSFTGTEEHILFSFVDAQGAVRSVQKLQDVPQERRRNVMVVDLSRTPEERQADKYVAFADLTVKGPDGRYHAALASRYPAPGAGAAADAPAPELGGADVVVYSASWCGFCKKTKAFLKQRGVPFREKDVERTPGAERELQQKAARAGVRVSGVPVTDFKGELVMGFDEPRLSQLIEQHAGKP